MDGADPTGMPGAPGFEEIECFAATHLADRNAIGTQAQRRLHQIGERRDTILRPQRDQVRRGALQLARILDQHNAVGGFRHFRQQGVRQGRLPGRGAAGNEDVLVPFDREPQHVGLALRHDAGRDVIGEREHGDRRLADRKGGRHHHWGQQALEAFASLGQLGRDAR